MNKNPVRVIQYVSSKGKRKLQTAKLSQIRSINIKGK